MEKNIKISKELQEYGGKISSTIDIKNHSLSVFDDGGVYVYSGRLYYSYFKVFPNIIHIYDLNYQKVLKYIETCLKEKILKRHSKEYYSYYKKKIKAENVIYIFENDIMIDVEDNGNVIILFSQHDSTEADKYILKFRQFKKRNTSKSYFSVLVNDVELKLIDVLNKKPKTALKENYNNDLLSIHKNLLVKLNQKDNSGLVLFHGSPGTGKSTYIRYLISSIKGRVIFLSPRMAGNLDSPFLIKTLLENPRTVIVIEDAEELLMSRDSIENSGISTLLNLTDGILGESLSIKVICTFNTNISNIDKALLRKGRLIALYEFKHLSIEKSKMLLEKNGIKNMTPKMEMTLADIYNFNDHDFIYNRSQNAPIGFITQGQYLNQVQP